MTGDFSASHLFHGQLVAILSWSRPGLELRGQSTLLKALDSGSPSPSSPRYLPLSGSWAWTRWGWAWTTALGLCLPPPPLSFQALHLNWCQQVKFIPQLNLVASCSAIDKSSLVLTVLPSKVPESLK